MAISTTTTRQKIQRCLQTFDFEKLFIDVLGWDFLRELPLSISFEKHHFTLHSLTEKRGFRVYLCSPYAQGNIPADHLLRKIEREVIKYAYEHIIIFIDHGKTAQVWQWVKREQGKPATTRLHRYYKGQSGEGLAQRLEALVIAIDEEEQLRAVEVAGRVAKAFDVERVTRKFYDRFKLEYAAFLTFIEGISIQGDREWYASLMLNRLMFIYFIQRKDFLGTTSPHTLDGDCNYLANRLQAMQKQQGGHQPGNRFQTFYRYFLLKLFHDGLSRRENERSPELQALLGNVPYLNGGLFDVHTLENAYPEIDIPDEAFEKLFRFFNEFEWHLDNRPLRDDREINPDVLGYIFEKYINQKQMGAYYTKEDITGYISQNTIIPFIFDDVEQKDPVAFRPDGSIWSLLREDPDRYIYEAVKQGCEQPLPQEIMVGVQDVAQRGEWNKAATGAYALPTEIWREVVARRTRYEEVRARLAAGEVRSINDLITYNLDMRRFATDVITYCEGPDLLLAFYQAIASVTVLDPTCGSGAFLFAALNILEPLYEACLDSMQNLVDERDQLDSAIPVEKRRRYPAIEQFRAILNEANEHSSRKYFIYKSIIINNLYGVDMMEEATEICKLRLFLKLVSQVQKFKDIEPLPDIDFNIRAGNTLVGFASYEETQKALQGKTVGKGIGRESSAYQNQMIFDDRMDRIEQKAQEIERAFKNFRRIQTEISQNPADMTANKQHLRRMLKELGAELDGYLASEYGIDRNNIAQKEAYDEKFNHWQESHQPFHWLVEFYGIMKRGGFDVIIGNPPYLELREVNYQPRGFRCFESGAIHAMCIERSLQLLGKRGCASMIVPLALVSTQRMQAVQGLLERERSAWYANYAWRPAKLFDAVNRALTIFIANPASNTKTFSTRYQKWTANNREMLMTAIDYAEVPRQRPAFWVPKFGNDIERLILEKLLGTRSVLSRFMANSSNRVYYRTTGGLYWKVFTDFPPAFTVNGQEGHSTRETWFTLATTEMVQPAVAILSSDVFWWWYTITTNCRDLNPYDIQNFPVPESAITDPALIDLGEHYSRDVKQNSTMLVRMQRQTGRTETQSFKIQKSKAIIDEIDRVLARHYGLSDEELDFIINYDIKYRVGRDNGDEGAE